MNGLILYIIKSAIYTSVFLSFYLLVMRKTTFFRLNRAVFIAGTMLCLALPFVKVKMPSGSMVSTPMSMIEESLAAQPITLAEAVVGDVTHINMTSLIIGVLFLAGAIISLTITCISYIRMSRLIRSVKTVMIDGTPVKVVEDEVPSFSWGRHIVIGRKDLHENPAILTHEKMHVMCGHSMDLMVYTAVTTLQWFNPLVWIARTELKMLHEYEADQLTINKGIDATQYQLLLVKKAVGAKRFHLANGFNHSKLKNRITMMHKNKTNRWMRLAYLLCAPVLIGAMCCCAHNPKSGVLTPAEDVTFNGVTINVTSMDRELDSTLENFTASQLNDLLTQSGKDLSEVFIEVKFAEDVTDQTKESLRETLRSLGTQKVSYESTQSPESDPGIPFQLVDIKPTFNGGDANTFSRWVNSQLTYPEKCRKEGIGGRVTISFTVSQSGKVTDVKVLRGVHEDLDNEAVRVVSSSPDWKPGFQNGKAVAVTYVFPVIFQSRKTENGK